MSRVVFGRGRSKSRKLTTITCPFPSSLEALLGRGCTSALGLFLVANNVSPEGLILEYPNITNDYLTV